MYSFFKYSSCLSSQTLIIIISDFKLLKGKNNKKINIVVATSGDTGAAAIDAIKGKSNLNIFVLHPNNRISSVQRKIMTTVEEKMFLILQLMETLMIVKYCKTNVSDLEFSKSINMSGVNSINWARIIAQAVYYFMHILN